MSDILLREGARPMRMLFFGGFYCHGERQTVSKGWKYIFIRITIKGYRNYNVTVW